MKEIFKKNRRFILYAVIGATGATLDYLVFLCLYDLLKIDPVVATLFSTSCGIINNFFWNIKLNFKVRDRLHHRFIIFYSVGLVGLLLSALIIYVLHDLAGVNANLAKLVSIPVVVIGQYLINSRFSLSDEFINFGRKPRAKNG